MSDTAIGGRIVDRWPPRNPFEDVDLRIAVEQEVERLEPFDRTLLVGSANGVSLEEIGGMLGVTRQRAGFLVKQIKGRVRSAIVG